MIIHQPEKQVIEGVVYLSSRIETKQKFLNIPKKVWFQFPEEYREDINPKHSDGIALSLLQLAMMGNEDLEIRGSISPRLAYGLQEYMYIYNTWEPKVFKRINIKYSKLEKKDNLLPNRGVASVFSGGVDSFFTLWSHLPENQKIETMRITHGVYLHGYDIQLSDKDLFDRTFLQYQKIFQKNDLTLIPVRTNIKMFYELRVPWAFIFGAPLIGVGHILSNVIKRLYMASGLNYSDIHIDGSTPLNDHWVSSEALEAIHHGANTSRAEKLSIVSDWVDVQKSLKVCLDTKNVKEHINCSKCGKCRRTMVMLDLIDKREKFEVFEKPPLWKILWGWMFLREINSFYAEKIVLAAFRKRKYLLSVWMLLILIIDSIQKFLKKIVRKIIPNTLLYKFKSKMFPLDSEEGYLNGS